MWRQVLGRGCCHRAWARSCHHSGQSSMRVDYGQWQRARAPRQRRTSWQPSPTWVAKCTIEDRQHRPCDGLPGSRRQRRNFRLPGSAQAPRAAPATRAAALPPFWPPSARRKTYKVDESASASKAIERQLGLDVTSGAVLTFLTDEINTWLRSMGHLKMSERTSVPLTFHK